MPYTALHRALGMPASPLTNDMIDAAVRAQISEMDDLDWKKSFPVAKEIAKSDVLKDIAAMANSGGGVIIYGVAEDQKKATSRVHVGEVTENYVRTFQVAAVNHIHPPVRKIKLFPLGDDRERALVVVVPYSVDVPHLIYRGEHFGAPIRNDADTIWMREPQLERLYRTRLDNQRKVQLQRERELEQKRLRLEEDVSQERLQREQERFQREKEQAQRQLEDDFKQARLQREQELGQVQRLLKEAFDQARLQRVTDQRVWMIGVAHPRTSPSSGSPLSRLDANRIVDGAIELGTSIAGSSKYRPLNSVYPAVGTGFRRWVASPGSSSEPWREAWAEVHFDGSVSLAAVIGGMPLRTSSADDTTISSRRFEWFVADLLALIRKAAESGDKVDYQVRLGLEHRNRGPITVNHVNDGGFQLGSGPSRITHFIPVETTIRTTVADEGYLDQIRRVALDVMNQAGISRLVSIK
ncbi:hypothetical protein BS329_30630 [Amycolatopsis coloradensis]|uniref:Schlafen AlbA-2 domain-containing protein n=1 Tax=Amycolatopsis coloradensis TaxID=76021 RepID=A0A1R0KJ19_9PSEU|nr:RNA-binding domain-containing protein [Amycolatopsis coloradensis]OLZ46037.1 hypothetical protein BS329_30630 [Amycolatopsis coloradensis]